MDAYIMTERLFFIKEFDYSVQKFSILNSIISRRIDMHPPDSKLKFLVFSLLPLTSCTSRITRPEV